VGKRSWQTPQLSILVRGRRDEAVLATCKWAPAGPEGVNNGCFEVIPGGCDICETIAAS